MFSRAYKSLARLQFGLLIMFIAGFVFVQDAYSQEDRTTGLKAESKIEQPLIETELSAYKAVACSAGEINAKISELRDEKVLVKFPEITVTKEKVIDELVRLIRTELAKLTGS
jgi:hypothetical protein